MDQRCGKTWGQEQALVPVDLEYAPAVAAKNSTIAFGQALGRYTAKITWHAR